MADGDAITDDVTMTFIDTNTQDLSVLTGTRAEFGDAAAGISSWRTQRYVDAGFYDPYVVEECLAAGLEIESGGQDDYEIVAVDATGKLQATISLRRPGNVEGWVLGDRDRPRFALEKIHGDEFLASFGDLPADRCWEIGRFSRDRSCESSRAVVAVTTAAALLIADLAREGHAALIVGEVEPTVALRHLREFGVPIVTGTPVTSAAVTGILAGRYAGTTVVPFAVDTSAITACDTDRWACLSQRRHLLKDRTHASV